MSLSEEALKLIGGDRRESYGPVRQGFEEIAQVWSIILKTPVDAQQVAQCMIAQKLCRDTYKPKRDNLVDIIGYTELLGALRGEPMKVENT